MSEDVSVTATGLGACEQPDRYIQQLVKHWSHKMATSYNDGLGAFPFSELEHATMQVHPDGIAITLTTADAERNAQLRGVIERHIDRFAFREAPLSYEWKDQ